MTEPPTVAPRTDALAASVPAAYAKWAGPVLTCGALLGIAVLQYWVPDDPRFRGSVNAEGAREFARALFGAAPAPLGTQAYRWLFIALVALAWAGYALLIRGGLKGAVLGRKQVLWTGAAVCALLAVFFPASLSHDLYAYLGFARTGAVHGLNPYMVSLAQMAAKGDWAAVRYPAPHASIYGPLWTLLTSGIAWAMRSTGFVPQAIALKSVQGAAVVLGAFSAHSLAEKWDPRHADLAAAAFAMNPLLLVEGPGSGHADILMVVLMVSGLALVERSWWRSGYLLLGLSAAVKFVSIAIVPMVLMRQLASLPRERRVSRLIGALATSAVPLIAGFVPFWEGPQTMRPLLGLAENRAQAGAGLAWHFSAVAVLYIAALVWLAKDAEKRLPSAWVIWSASAIGLAFPGTLPWYFAWPVAATVTRWQRTGRYLTYACMALAAGWMLLYVQVRSG